MEWEFIHIYTRAQAIEDGVLIDVTDTAKDYGFRVPVAFTAGVWAELVADSECPDGCCSTLGRVMNILSQLTGALRDLPESKRNVDRVAFVVRTLDENRQPKSVTLKAVCGPGDNAEPVITVMLPGED